jgi:FkbM family methyltransferase
VAQIENVRLPTGELVRLTGLTISARFSARLSAGVLHEAGVVAAFVRAARRATCLFDVGAHLGWYASVAVAANPRVATVLIEPNPASLAVAVRNVILNGGRRPVALGLAVGRRRSNGWLVQDVSGDSMLCRVSRAQPVCGPSVGVPIRSIDEIGAHLGLTPDLVKVDVEGDEVVTLKGARRLLATGHPLLFVEVHTRESGSASCTYAAVRRLLEEQGYNIAIYDKDRGLLSDAKYEPGMTAHPVLVASPTSELPALA